MVNASVSKVVCSTSCALAEPVAGLALAERGDEVVGQLMITYEWSDWRDGYFWWIRSPERYDAVGIFGQSVTTFRDRRLIIVQNAAWPHATGKELSAARNAMFETPSTVNTRIPVPMKAATGPFTAPVFA